MSDFTKSAEGNGTRQERVARRSGLVPSNRSRATADPLSETGVLRLLNECPAPERSPERVVGGTSVREERSVAAPEAGSLAGDAAISCPRCGHCLAAEIEICPRCRTRLATSSKAWQAVYRAAARALAAR